MKLTKKDFEDIEDDILSLQALAKEIWGEGIYNGDDWNSLLTWEYYLSEIITSKEPIKYLKKFLEK